MKKSYNWCVILLILLLTGCGIVTLYSTTSNWADPLWKKQSVWAGIGTIGLIVASLIDYAIFKRYALFIYITAIILLVVVLFMPPVRSARSWFVLPFFSFQPSEFAKLSTIIMLSLYLKDKSGKFNSAHSFLFPGIIVSIPVFLILLQPDLGSSLIFFPILFSMLYILEPNRFIFYSIFFFLLFFYIEVIFFSYLFFKGCELKSIFIWLSIISILFFAVSIVYGRNKKSKRYIIIVFMLILSLVGSLASLKILKDYQKKRLLVFLNQSFDPLGAGYNITQSKIAIGGGGIHGTGFLQGSQSHLGFLPEKASDFIFSVYAEEFGFIGVFSLLFLLLLFTIMGLSIARSVLDPFSSLLACGICSMIAYSAFINIGVCCGILPVTGIPLPFISYGGSSLFINMVSVGILLSVKRRTR